MRYVGRMCGYFVELLGNRGLEKMAEYRVGMLCRGEGSRHLL